MVSAEELVSGRKGLPRLGARIVMSVFGIDKANRIYDKTYYAEDYTGTILKSIGISYIIDPADLARIPAEGPAMVICNHPTGALDGIVLLDLLSRVRPDVKFMSNFLLSRIEPLRKHLIKVDPFDSRSRDTNMKGVRDSLTHLRNGGLIATFPSGEVSTWQDGWRGIRDREWDPAAMKFIRRAGVPVIPMYIEARNSTLFRLMGKIHPMLRTAMIPRELFNKKGKRVRVIAGTAAPVKRLEELGDREYDNYLRASVDYLKGSREPGKTPPRIEVDIMKGIVERPPVEVLRAEMDAIREKHLLFDHSGSSLFCAPTGKIPNIMTEIGRCREITFREIGEGTRKAVDIDRYDSYYNQLFIWDNEADALVGAYRIGFGDEIIARYGIEGFYTHSLFRFSKEMAPVLEKTIELGRSFVMREYQKKPASLMLLWKGILYVLLKNNQFRNMMGPVTISGEFRSASKLIIAEYLRREFYNDELARFVTPVTGIKGIESDIDLSLIDGIKSIELIGKLVHDIEQDERPVPVLIKKYLGLSSTVLGFNVDPDFSDALDALMLLDMKHVPESTIMMLSKEITDIDVVARFKELQPACNLPGNAKKSRRRFKA